MKIEQTNNLYIVQCRSCKLIHRLTANGFDFDEVSSEEREMGAEVCHEAEMNITCDCGQELSVKAECWEYPVGSAGRVDVTVNNCVLVMEPEFDCVYKYAKNKEGE